MDRFREWLCNNVPLASMLLVAVLLTSLVAASG